MKRFERSNGLDTALYKNYLFNYLFHIIRLLCRPTPAYCMNQWCSGSDSAKVFCSICFQKVECSSQLSMIIIK